MSGSTWGPVLRDMRLLYYSKILSIVQYASPAWFFASEHTVRQGHVLKSLARRLDMLQGKWLAKISGAMKNTTRIVLRKELHVFRLSEYLQMKTISNHAKNYDTKHAQEIRTARYRALQHNMSLHLFHKLDILAQQLIKLAKGRTQCIKENLAKAKAKREKEGKGEAAQNSTGDEKDQDKDIWGDPACVQERRLAIDQTAKDILNYRAYHEWARYQKKHRKRPLQEQILAIKEPWSLKSLKYYDKLRTRQECTMLLHCRTGFIGLRSHLYRVGKAKTDRCPYCENGPHSIEHLFLFCGGGDKKGVEMADAQRALYANVGEEHFNLSDIFPHHPEKAVQFAISTFGIPQFCKDNWDDSKKQS
ncbi:uncharacterized protein TRIVIDRAFT_206869 [Trichoderma virens Gv29-8]|uniref:Reverse transcriptase zinc-binding domain-containing protein n=1 Tax=Hypocrea virens (strain Gv29-8 / FGSC 10586) TaxID=413071 RepID=G9NBM2_HYPVG|nr:uncharacterized protein TRIVIDRAFT_206869 [Trichoderma virens Gv29-8]EHK16227.1 hypothetical protein TRIVIDRAFT_206869 [Trichoderma virens Gv29-8]